MGIPRFLSFLKATYKNNNWFVQKNILDSESKKWDYFILDYQSLIYSTYEVFYSDINYFIRIITKLNSEFNDTYLDIAMNIIDKYHKYFLIIFKNNIPPFQSNKLEPFLNANYNDLNMILESLVDMMVEHTKELAIFHCIEKPFTNTYIFFDGIPSLAKIKEQAGRRIYPVIMKEITAKIYNTIDSCIEKEVRSKLLPEFPPTISLGSTTVNRLREELMKVNDMKYGKFNINDIRYGEAEHQIMTALLNNKDKFIGKKILLASPDADLILLCLIISTKGYKIDIFRENAIGEKTFQKVDNSTTSGFHKVYDYIYMDLLKINLGFHNNQKIVDICYALLLLGDDFVPIIPTINVKMMPSILNTYDDLVKHSNNKFKLINISVKDDENVLLYDNLALYIQELAKKESKWYKIMITNFNKGIPRIKDKIGEFHKYSKYFFIEEFSGTNHKNLNQYKKLYLLNSGFVNNGDKYISLIKPKEHIKFKPDNDKFKNYMEGCYFIFDLYINNNIRDYSWFYRYEDAPTLIDLNNYLMKQKSSDFPKIFNYVNNNNNIYLDINTYRTYIDDYMNKIILDLIHNINNTGMNKRTIVDEMDMNGLKTKYFTYDNIKNLFNCNGKTYFNKCLQIEPPIMLDKKYTVIMNQKLL